MSRTTTLDSRLVPALFNACRKGSLGIDSLTNLSVITPLCGESPIKLGPLIWGTNPEQTTVLITVRSSLPKIDSRHPRAPKIAFALMQFITPLVRCAETASYSSRGGNQSLCVPAGPQPFSAISAECECHKQKGAFGEDKKQDRDTRIENRRVSLDEVSSKEAAQEVTRVGPTAPN